MNVETFETVQIGGPLELDERLEELLGSAVDAAEGLIDCHYCGADLELGVGIGELVVVRKPRRWEDWAFVLCGPCSIAEALDEEETNR